MTKNSSYYTKHTALTSSHHITYTNDNGTKKRIICITYSKLQLVLILTKKN